MTTVRQLVSDLQTAYHVTGDDLLRCELRVDEVPVAGIRSSQSGRCVDLLPEPTLTPLTVRDVLHQLRAACVSQAALVDAPVHGSADGAELYRTTVTASVLTMTCDLVTTTTHNRLTMARERRTRPASRPRVMEVDQLLNEDGDRFTAWQRLIANQTAERP